MWVVPPWPDGEQAGKYRPWEEVFSMCASLEAEGSCLFIAGFGVSKFSDSERQGKRKEIKAKLNAEGLSDFHACIAAATRTLAFPPAFD